MSVMIALLFGVVDHAAILIGLIQIESSGFHPNILLTVFKRTWQSSAMRT